MDNKQIGPGIGLSCKGTPFNSRLLVVAGATASGKSKLCLQLAKKLKGEIVNLDSVQVYRGFDISSAKPSIEEQASVPHHLLDICGVGQDFDGAKYIEAAQSVIAEIQGRQMLPIICGGTSMYLTLLLHGLAELPGTQEDERERLNDLSTTELFEELKRLDPFSATRIHPADRVRVMRIIESSIALQRPASDILKSHGFQSIRYSALILVLSTDPPTLRRRIKARVEDMIRRGLVEETLRLVQSYGAEHRAFGAIGYRQVLSLIKENCEPEKLSDVVRLELIEKISIATNQFAKRQRTFWRNEPRKRGWEILSSLQSINERPLNDNVISNDNKGLSDISSWKITNDQLYPQIESILCDPSRRQKIEVIYLDSEALGI